MKANKQNIETVNGLSFRHAAQIVRRKMMSKIYTDKNDYNRKDKSWKNLL